MKDFIRRRGFRPLTRTLSEGGGTSELMAAYALARRAGEVIQPILKPFRLVIDFSQGHTRMEGSTLVLLAQNAAQLNRLRHLTPRLLSALVVKGLPILAIEVRIAPPAEPEPEPPPPAPPRPASIAGAAALRTGAATLENPELRDVMERLAEAVRPRAEDRSEALSAALDGVVVSLRELLAGLARLEASLPEAPDAKLIPSESDAAESSELAGVRGRLLEKFLTRKGLEMRIVLLRTHAGEALLAAEAARLPLAIATADEKSAPTSGELDGIEADYLRLHERTAELLAERKAIADEIA